MLDTRKANTQPVILKDVEVISTEEGELFPLFRDWDPWHDAYEPKMLYVTTIGPGILKGPILHKKRKSFMTALTGILKLTCYYQEKFFTYELINELGQSKIALIQENIPVVLENVSKTNIATVINLPSKSWHPDDQDTYKFDSWAEFISGKT